ncbi:MAG: class I SAM-dependent methyltransferase [Actinomycetota bacterium]
MFDVIAPRYDLANTLFSAGEDRHWRRVAARAATLAPGDEALDVACGTGALAMALLEEQPALRVVGVDVSAGMLARAAARSDDRAEFLVGDAANLPFEDGRFAAVTIGFGLRNLRDPTAGLEEMRRVTRPGGRLVVLEFSHPTSPAFRTAYLAYLTRVMPALARALTPRSSAYVYLAETVAAWPNQKELARIIALSGWSEVRWKNLTGGIVAVHQAVVR